jgi:rare lipoprotein A
MVGIILTRMSGMQLALGLTTALLLAGCDENGKFSLGGGGGGDAAPGAVAQSQSTELVQTDVEAPEVFQLTTQGLWDGRPSLGGVWVAHPDVTDPERVIIRNSTNGQFVIGALFRRERENPGPALQVSSDAADALGMLAGAPAELNVTALRREEAAAPTAVAPVADFGAESAELAAPGEIAAMPLDPATGDAAIATTPLDPIAGAAAAIDAADAAAAGSDEPPPDPAIAAAIPPATETPAVGSALTKPFIQIGIFSVEANANTAAGQMTDLGLTARVVPQTAQGRDFWSVIVGPATSEADRAAQLAKITGAGFTDAYFVRN